MKDLLKIIQIELFFLILGRDLIGILIYTTEEAQVIIPLEDLYPVTLVSIGQIHLFSVI